MVIISAPNARFRFAIFFSISKSGFFKVTAIKNSSQISHSLTPVKITRGVEEMS